MGLLDIIKSKKKRKAEEKLKRPPKGALKAPKKPEIDVEPEEDKAPKKAEQKGRKSALASKILLSPHITEKATLSSERGVYVFRVSSRANKIMIKQAIKELYGFAPKKVSIVNVPSKTRFSRGKAGTRPGYKKAMIYLKEGDKIDIA